MCAVLSLSVFLTPWTATRQAPLSMEILQARILGWVAMPSSSQPRDWTQVSHIAGRFFTIWASREAQEYWSEQHIFSPGDLPDPGIEPGSPALQILYQLSYHGSPVYTYNESLISLKKGMKFWHILQHGWAWGNNAKCNKPDTRGQILHRQLVWGTQNRLLCPWDSLGKNTGVGCHALLQRIFPTPGSNTCLLLSPSLAGGLFTTSATWKASVKIIKW